jgi:hypothetical protein
VLLFFALLQMAFEVDWALMQIVSMCGKVIRSVRRSGTSLFSFHTHGIDLPDFLTTGAVVAAAPIQFLLYLTSCNPIGSV